MLNANGGDDVVEPGDGLAALIGSLSTEVPATTTSSEATGTTSCWAATVTTSIDGRNGDDVALLGAGSDRFHWNPGDDDDVVEGQAWTDELLFNGPTRARASTSRPTVAGCGSSETSRTCSMDLNDVEKVLFNAFGGVRYVHVGDLSGTDADRCGRQIWRPPGRFVSRLHGRPVRSTATNGDDMVTVLGSTSEQQVAGLAASGDCPARRRRTDRPDHGGPG